MAFLTFVGACLRILAHGYLPPDDALRHAAFAVSGRSWDQLLVGRPEALFDQSPGWHAFLRLLHAVTGWGPEALVLVSVGLCLLLFFLAGLLWVRHWEAWVLTLAAFFLMDGSLIQRLALGRPFVVTAALLVCLLGSVRTPGLRPWWSRHHLGWVAACALATWIHGSWYLLLLVPGAVLLAGRWREALRLGAALLAGCLLGATLTGHPFRFALGQVGHLWAALGQPATPKGLAMEFLPGLQPLLPLVFMGLAALWNRQQIRLRGLQTDATFILAALTWIAGYAWVWRLYLDWAFPAMALWTTWQLDEALSEAQLPTWGRVQLSALAAVAFVAITGVDLSGRWTLDGSSQGLAPLRPDTDALLPEPGGVLYATSMYVFYATFFHHPHGQWRYVLGYEPGLMKAEDAAVYQASFGPQEPSRALAPWIRRMGPKDRLVLEGSSNQPPRITALSWTYTGINKWVGRKLEQTPGNPAR